MWRNKHIVFLVIITFLVYFSSFFNPFVWDDEQFIYNNKFVATFDIKHILTSNTIAGAGELSNYYRPLTTLSFAWDYLFWGVNPFGYHFSNTLIHVGVGILLYILLWQLAIPKKISFWIALIFLLHPIQTEAVTYINSRGDSMYSMFGIASLLTFLLFYKNKTFDFSIYNLKFSITKSTFFILTPILYTLSILGKEIGIAILGLQGLLLSHQYLISKSKNIFSFISKQKSTVIILGINFLIAGGYVFLRATVLNFNNTFDFYEDEQIYSNNIFVRLFTFTKIIFIYLRLLFIPFPLHMERTTTVITSLFNIWGILLGVLVFSIIFTGLSEIKKRKTSYILLGWGWFMIMLLPVSGIIPINGLLYEHWLYLPMVGILIALYGTFQLYFKENFSSAIFKIIIAVTIIFSLLTLRQNYLWGDPIRFYTYLLQHTNSARIHNNLAMALSETGNYQEAINHYNKALEYGIPYPNIYHNLANTYVTLKRFDEAETAYLQALKNDPYFFHSYNNLINLYHLQGKYEKAIKVAQEAQEHFKDSPTYYLSELQLLKLSNNKAGFNQRKAELQDLFQANQVLRDSITPVTY